MKEIHDDALQSNYPSFVLVTQDMEYPRGFAEVKDAVSQERSWK